VNSETSTVSVAHMRSPGGWKEPGQTPEFEQYTLVLKGVQHVEDKDGSLDVRAGQLSLCARVNGYRIRLWSRGLSIDGTVHRNE
jgi:hypothetical protein